MATTTMQATQIKTASGFDVLAGIWLIIAPFALNYSANAGSTVNDIVVGAVVILLAGYEMIGEHFRQSTASWLNVLLGAWLVFAPFALNIPSGSAAMWNDLIAGVVIGGLALYSALTTPSEIEG